MLPVVASLQHTTLIVQTVCHSSTVYLHARCENHQVVPLWNLCAEVNEIIFAFFFFFYGVWMIGVGSWGWFVSSCCWLSNCEYLLWRQELVIKKVLGVVKRRESLLTTSRKKSTCGLLWTKKRTGCLSIVTFTTKSGGVPGFTVCLITPSWWEWMSVSSKSRTRIFLLTIPWNARKGLDIVKVIVQIFYTYSACV